MPQPHVPELYIASLGERATIEASRITTELRRCGIAAECDIMGRSLKAQMKYADKLGANFTLILGDAEIDSGTAIIKNMRDSVQTEIKISDVAGFICNNIEK